MKRRLQYGGKRLTFEDVDDSARMDAPVQRVRRGRGRPTRASASKSAMIISNLKQMMTGIAGGTSYPKKLEKSGFTYEDFANIQLSDDKAITSFLTKVSARAKIRPGRRKMIHMIKQAQSI